MPVIDILVPHDHPAFPGHFPGMPIVPGVVLLDETLWAIAAATGVSLAQCTIASIKFKSVVRQGQPVTLRFEPTAECGFRFELRSLDRPVASGAISVTVPRGAVDGG